MRPPGTPRRVLPLLTAVNSVGVIVLAALLVFAFQSRGEQLAQIQMERQRNVRTNCQDINDRHHRTLFELDRGYDRAARGASQARRRQLEESRRFSTLLIDRLVPKRDCEALARRQVDRSP